ncbi:MAG TPA: HPF/RaiA family ribosome-associated protein [Gemmatimonadales bacterium]|nr:HPF/RaiA family ribosome-associated protein [Gemmatimonadales bacterium]
MLPLRIAVRNTELSPARETDIRHRVALLTRHYDRIMNCVVTVEVPQRRRRSDAAQYRVRLDLTLPRGELAITHQPRADLRTAVQDVFRTAERRLEAYTRRLNGAVKRHEPPPIGRVSQYYPLAGYGFIEAPDGHELYFDKNSVLENAFDRLDVGMEVRFNEEPGEKGPQATSVALVAQHHVAAQE